MQCHTFSFKFTDSKFTSNVSNAEKNLPGSHSTSTAFPTYPSGIAIRWISGSTSTTLRHVYVLPFLSLSFEIDFSKCCMMLLYNLNRLFNIFNCTDSHAPHLRAPYPKSQSIAQWDEFVQGGSQACKLCAASVAPFLCSIPPHLLLSFECLPS